MEDIGHAIGAKPSDDDELEQMSDGDKQPSKSSSNSEKSVIDVDLYEGPSSSAMMHKYKIRHVKIYDSWALAIFELRTSTLYLFDSLQNAKYFDADLPLLVKMATYIYDNLDEKGMWKRSWHVIARPMNVIQQKNGNDCGVFTCIHAALYFTKATGTGVIPRIVEQTSETWRALIHSYLITASLTPLEAAFLADVSLE